MKQQLYLLMLTLFPIATYGQVIPKDVVFFGGNLAFNQVEKKEKNIFKNNSLYVGLGGSYSNFIKDNFSINITFHYSVPINELSRVRANYSVDSYILSLGVYLRNYKMASKKLGFFIQYGAGATYLSSVKFYGISPEENESVNFHCSIGSGITYFLKKNTTIEITTAIANLSVGKIIERNTYVFNIGIKPLNYIGLGITSSYSL